MTSKWATTLSGGKSADDYLKENTDYTDKELVKVLSGHGFKTTDSGVRARRIKIRVTKVQGSNRRESPVAKESHRKSGDVWSVELDNSRISNQDEFIKKYNIDLSEWEISEFTISYHELPHFEKATGDSTFWQREEGDMEITPLTHIKATLKRKKNIVFARDEIDDLKTLANKFSPHYTKIKYPKVKDGKLLVVNMPDLHYNSLAQGKETGYADWDIKISDSTFRAAFTHILSAAQHYNLEKIVFVIGNDFFSADNVEGTTTRGTYVTIDSRYHKVFKTARMMLIWAIDQLIKIAPTEIKVVPGNHDTLTAWQMGDSLECWYHNCKNIVVDNSPISRKYLEYGKVMLAWIHGDKGKRPDYPLLVSTEQREMWGRTKFCEIHTGHNHIVELKEYHGVRVRILPSLVAPDDWHSENGFVGHLQSAEAYLYNKETGLAGTIVYTIPREK